jgi:mono/diheme cytochrome c family protein
MIKKIAVLLVITIIAAAIPVMAAEIDGAALFKTRCSACHGLDGKKMPKVDLGGAAVQATSDADLATFIGTNAKHNFKTKGLTDDQIKAIVSHVRSLKR